MDKLIGCDFYIGDRVDTYIKLMDYKTLNGFKGILKNTKLIGHFFWQKGAVKTVGMHYDLYILTGDPYCVSNWFILLMCRLIGKKTYLWTHGWYGNETNLKCIIKKNYFGLANKILLYGNYAKKLMILKGFKECKLVTVFNSLNDDVLYTMRPLLRLTPTYENHFGNKNPILLYIGRIQRSKKLSLLLDAMDLLRQRSRSYNLIIIGKEVENTGLEQKIVSLNLSEQVWLYGDCYDEAELANLIFNATLCVSPGNVGLTAMHAMFYGTPVITHGNFSNQGPEFEAIQPGLTGDFFDENSAFDLADTIERWVDMHLARRQVNEACFNVIDKYYNSNLQINILKECLK
jgi:glycosyltransferase involved in cell wall biosynthesis